jgi:hypothetical protein
MKIFKAARKVPRESVKFSDNSRPRKNPRFPNKISIFINLKNIGYFSPTSAVKFFDMIERLGARSAPLTFPSSVAGLAGLCGTGFLGAFLSSGGTAQSAGAPALAVK